MKLLKEFICQQGINFAGRAIVREAVRGIILKESDVLMIFSDHNGDYKFPGGGIQGKETHEETLRREIKEESGATVTKIGRGFGKVIEYDIPVEQSYDVFKMTSYYYLCQISGGLDKQNLDQYEEDLGFRPVWVDIETAIETNRSIISREFPRVPRWTPRDLYVLEEIGSLGIHGAENKMKRKE